MSSTPLASPLACPAPAPSASRLSRARTATRVLFAVLGLAGGAWGVHIPSVKAQYGLDEAMLSLVLLSAAAGAVTSLFTAGRVVAWLGARGAARVCAVVMGALLALVLQWPSLALLLPAMLAFGAAMSLYDVAINAEGSALEALGGTTIMSGLHGMFSLGAMGGAALAAGLLRLEVSPQTQLAGVGLLMAATVLWAARGMLDTHPAPEPDEAAQAQFAWPRGQLLVIGLLIFAGMSAEGVMYDWCVLYLKQEIGMPQAQAGLGYAAFAGAMALARFAGDWLRTRHDEASLLAYSAGLSAFAMAVVLVCADPWVALVGYVFVGAGLAPVVPILYNAATRVPGTSRAAAIASVSSIGYSGFLIGPPLIGAIAHALSLAAAMSVVVISASLLSICAHRIPVARAAPRS
ncbi:MAG: hypothetical protein QG612_1859 [Pseudomonadota bacterium]|nr:hypothetical protein [Pseudomonadota bacterium]